jgi:hypothetical protein
MAAVSLKDLMDPLSKIAINTNETTKRLDKLIELVGANGASSAGNAKEDNKNKTNKDALASLGVLSASAGTLVEALVKLKGAQKSVNTFIDLIRGTGEALSEFKNPEESLKAAETIDVIGKSVLRYAVSLALAAPLLILAMPGAVLLGLSIRLLVASAGTAAEGLKNFEAISAIGRGALGYALGMALVAVLAPLVLIGSAVFGLSVRLLVATAGIGEANVQAMNAVSLLGKGALIFAGTMALVALVAPLVLLGATAFSLSVLMVGLSLKVLGKNPQKLGRGLIFMGLGILAFSASLALSAMILDGDPNEYLKVGLLLAGTAIVFYFIGKGWKQIGYGGLVVAGMGLALLIFNFGYIPFMETAQMITLEDIGRQTGLLTGIGTVFALAGAAAVAIIPGAAAFAAVGLSLMFLTAGLKVFQMLKWTEDDSTILTGALTGIKLAFLGSDEKPDGFFEELGGVVTGAINAVKMVEAAAGFAAAGISLLFLAYGLNKFKALKWKEEDTETLTTTLGGITAAFASAGGSPSNPGGIFGAVFGTTFEPNAVERGVDSVMDAGKALTNIAKGLMSFQNLINKGVVFGEPDESGNYKEKGSLGYAVQHTLGFVNSAFAAIGNQKDVNDNGFWGALGFKENIVAKGVNAVKGAGQELTNIVTGLQSFQTLIKNGVKFGEPDADGKYGENQKGTLGWAISRTLGFVSSAFAAIGNQGDKDDTGFWGALGFKENIVAKGVNAVKGAGKELTTIVAGLQSFQTLINNGVKFGEADADGKFPAGTLGFAISRTLGFVSSAFATIGKGTESDDTGFWGALGFKENDVAKGVNAVKDAGKELTTIATGLTSFQNLINNGVKFGVPGTDGKFPAGTLGFAITNTLGFVGNAFAAIGGKNDKKSALFGLIKWDENKVNKGIKAVKGAGQELTNIATGLTKFESLKDPAGLSKNIATLLTNIGIAFSSVYLVNPKLSIQLKDFGNFIDILGKRAKDKSLQKAARDMAAMSKAINSIDIKKAQTFSDLFKYGAQMSANRNGDATIKALVKAVEDIKKILSKETTTTATATATTSAFPTFANNFMPAATAPAATTPAASNAQVMQQLSSTLDNLNTILANLPGAISQIEIIVKPR